MLQHFFLHPDLPVGLLGLLIHLPGDLHRRRHIANQRRLHQSSLKLGLMRLFALDPCGKVVLGGQEVRLGDVAFVVGQDKVVAEVGGVAGPRNEVVHLRQLRERL